MWCLERPLRLANASKHIFRGPSALTSNNRYRYRAIESTSTSFSLVRTRYFSTSSKGDKKAATAATAKPADFLSPSSLGAVGLLACASVPVVTGYYLWHHEVLGLGEYTKSEARAMEFSPLNAMGFGCALSFITGPVCGFLIGSSSLRVAISSLRLGEKALAIPALGMSMFATVYATVYGTLGGLVFAIPGGLLGLLLYPLAKCRLKQQGRENEKKEEQLESVERLGN